MCSLTSKVLSYMPYVVQMERRSLTQLFYMSHHGHVFIEPGPKIFYGCNRGNASVAYTKTINVHFRQLLPSAYYDQ